MMYDEVFLCFDDGGGWVVGGGYHDTWSRKHWGECNQ